MTSHRHNAEIKKNRNPAEYPVLGMLSRGPIHGYEICRDLSEGIGTIWRMGKSQVYQLLVRLEREGLVVHERVGQETLPAKNVFSLTQEGEEVLRQWLDQPVAHVRDMRLEFLIKLWFIRRSNPASESMLIEKQIAACRQKVEALERLKGSVRTQIESQSVGFRMKVVEAAISWLEGLVEGSKGMSLDRAENQRRCKYSDS